MTVRSLAAGWQPSRVSELMRGTGDYPRYEYVLSIARALKVTPGTLPVKELRISWKLGAQDLGKTDAWIDKCLHEEARRIARRRTWGQALAIVAMTTLTASLFLGMQQTEEDRFSDPPMTTPTTGPTLGQDEGPEPEPATPPPTTSPPLPLDRLKPYPVEPESLPAEHMAASDEDMPVYVGVARGRPDVRWKLPADTVVPVDCVTELKDEIFVRIAGKPGGFVKPADSSYLTKLTPGELPDCQLKR